MLPICTTQILKKLLSRLENFNAVSGKNVIKSGILRCIRSNLKERVSDEKRDIELIQSFAKR